MAVEAPKWFEEKFYLDAKAGQLNAIKFDGKADWTGDAVKAVFGQTTAYEHYMAFGKGENISPNSMFNVAEYLKAKADQLNADKFDGKATWTEADVLKSFNDSGLSAWDHFVQYGMAEGLNPSNMFDVDAYLINKAAQLNDAKFEGKTDWTADDVAASLKGAGLNPVQHYYLYGQGEGLTITKVPADDRVISSYNPYTPVNPGTTFPLTSGTDNIEGTAKDDIINGVSSALSAERTLNAEDTIDGKDGNDTLNVALKGNFNGFSTGSMANVENVVLTADGSIPLTFNAKGVTGVDTWTLNSKDAPISLSELDAAGITVNVQGLQEGNTIIGFTADAVKGDDDALTLGLNNVGTAETDSADAKYVNVIADGIEDLTVNVTDDNYVDLSNAATDTITVKGAGNLDVDAIAATVTSFDASGLSGDVSADLSGATLKTVKGGSGDDEIIVTGLAADAVIDGGAGNDTLVLSNVSGTLQPTIKGFENITASGGTLTISGKNVSDFNALTVMGGANVTLANMNTPTFTVTSEGATAGSVMLTDATALTYNTVADDQSIKDKTADAISTGITAGKATSATVNVGAYTAVTGTLDFGAAKDLTINVASGLGGADGKTEQTTFGGATTIVNANNAQSLVINAEGTLGAAEYNVSKAESVVIDAAKGSGALDINAGKASNVSITAGDAMNITGSDFTSAQNVTLVQDKGALTGSVALNAVNQLTVSGADNTSQINLGALGNALQAYGITVDASGLKGGLTVGAINAGQGDVTLNLDDVTGAFSATSTAGKNVTIHAAQLGSTSTGAITATGNVLIDAMGVLGGGIAANAFTAGAISTTKAVTINFDGNNDMAFAAVSGKSVNIDASGYLGAISNTANGSAGSATFGGTIIADSVTIKGSEIGANTFSVASAITADTLNFTGGLAVDTVSVTGKGGDKMDVTLNTGTGDDVVSVTAGAATANITVKGDMGGNAADAITVTAAAAVATTIDLSGLKGYAIGSLIGSSVADILKGGAGDDTITTGTNAALKSGDILTGGAGADIFEIGLFATGSVTVAADDITAIITDFGNGADTIKGLGDGNSVEYYEMSTATYADLAVLWTAIQADTTLTANTYIVTAMVGSDAYALNLVVAGSVGSETYTAHGVVQLAGVNLGQIDADAFVV